jgi:hypothetical protein
VYNINLASVKHQIPEVENPTPGVVISGEAASINNAILLDYLTTKVALEEREIRRTCPIIPMYNNCMDDELHLRMS